MTFFNKKEDILKLELTPHGRKLLSEGKLKPAYYAFFDDDILYDSERGGFTETNSQTKTRILTETPSLKPQVTHRGIDTKKNSSLSVDKMDSMVYPIGTNNFSGQEAVGWEAFLLQGEADTVSYNYVSETNENLKIPQVNCLLNFTMSVDNVRYGPFPVSDFFSYNEYSLAEDGTYISVKESELLIYLSEKNGFNTHDSFTAEVFLYDPDKTNYRKLDFITRTYDDNELENDILKPSATEGQGIRDQILDYITDDVVENYFEFMVDGEVSARSICKGLKSLKSKDIHVGIPEYINCDDLVGRTQDLGINIYSTAIGADEIEECPDE